MTKTVISKTEYTALSILTIYVDGLFGLELSRKSDERIAAGSVYTLLYRLKDKRLVKSKKETKLAEGQRCKRLIYQVTATAKTACAKFRKLNDYP